MSRVTGSEARDLLSHYRDVRTPLAPMVRDAPRLAETVAWLYGREPEDPETGIHSVRIRNGTDTDVVYWGVAHTGPHRLGEGPPTVVMHTDGGHRTLEEAEEFARAILQVVEDARGHHE